MNASRVSPCLTMSNSLSLTDNVMFAFAEPSCFSDSGVGVSLVICNTKKTLAMTKRKKAAAAISSVGRFDFGGMSSTLSTVLERRFAHCLTVALPLQIGDNNDAPGVNSHVSVSSPSR